MEQKSHRWSPIEDLPRDWKALENPEITALVQAWLTQADKLRQSTSYDTFLIQLRRQWAIETGYIERLYHISEGATKTLIAQGLDASLLSHEDTDKSSVEVIDIIKDQYHAIEGLYQFISGERELSKSYLKELHWVLTAHQPYYDAIDTLRNYVKRELPRGTWKSWKNNVENTEEGYVFEFCPPEQVESEVERLLDYHKVHERIGVPPDIEAAWLHHRFTLIHPFADGNGRVARCLATLVLLKARWFPLVVIRDDRANYMGALRQADLGDLKPLVMLFDTLQRRAVRQALSLSEEIVESSTTIYSIIDAVKDRFIKRRNEHPNEKQRVFVIAGDLQHLTSERMIGVAHEIDASIRSLDAAFKASYHGATPNDKEKLKYNDYQIRKCERELGYHANLHTFHAWYALEIDMDLCTEILFSFHGIGREFTGVLVCTAMFYTKHRTDADETIIGEVVPLSKEPFDFTYTEVEGDVIDRFRQWMDERLVKGLDLWRKVVGA